MLFGQHVLKMEILINGFAAAARRAGYLVIAGHRSMVTPARVVNSAHDGGARICHCCLQMLCQPDCAGLRGTPHKNAWCAHHARGRA